MKNREKLKKIKGYEGLYSITEYGRIYDHKINQYLKPQFKKEKRAYGYKERMFATLVKNGVESQHSIHRLVAQHYLHREPGKEVIDHIDRNTLNNHYSNLRWLTKRENLLNRGRCTSVQNGSRYKGVFWDKKWKRWRAQITYKGKRFNSKRFRTEVEAAKWYDQKAVELNGDIAYRNFH